MPAWYRSADMVCAKRPGTGIPATMSAKVVGARARCAIASDTLISWEQLENPKS